VKILKKLKILLFGDLHVGINKGNLPGKDALGLLQKFVKYLNDNIKPDLAIDLGDRLNSVDNEGNKKNLNLLASVLSELNCPIKYILGNHDLDNITLKENEEILNTSLSNQMISLEGFRFLLINSQDPIIDGIGGWISEESLSWIEKELKKSSDKFVLFTHQAIDDQSLDGNKNFNNIEKLAFVCNKRAIRDLLNKYSNVIASVNGHLHWSNLFFEKIPFITVPSFTETWNIYDRVCGAYTIIDFYEGGILVSNYTFQPNVLTSRFEVKIQKEG